MPNDNLPAHVATSMTEIGSITYASEVVAIIAGMAAAEIDGVAAMGTAASIVDLLGRKNKPVTRGVKVEVGSEEASVDLVFTVEYGKPIQRVCRDVQESVRKSIETMTGLHVVKVDVHVLGVSFEKEAQLNVDLAQAATAAVEPGRAASVTEGAQGATGPLGQIVRSRPLPIKDEPSSHPDGAVDDVDLPETSIDVSIDGLDDDLDGVSDDASDGLFVDDSDDPHAEPAAPFEPIMSFGTINTELLQTADDLQLDALLDAELNAGTVGTEKPTDILTETTNDVGDDETILADSTL
ncbi:hypothetical protein FACS1894184_04180 [Clostridia bacterium]|nr:hypothetical protein FACS1894184_04180 [Clostridia bacterium]